MDENIQILTFHIKVLKYLALWPRPTFSRTINNIVLYGCFCLSITFFIPVLWAVFYQLHEGIHDSRVLLEALIAVFDILGYMVAYICFLINKDKIERILKDINIFLQYCHPNVIRETDRLCTRYTKFMLVYVSTGVAINLVWPLMSRKRCIEERDSEFYLRHDPCGMPTHNFYPFDASQPSVFWVVFIIEAIYVCHICYVFSMATATILGLLAHITSQLKNCGAKFQEVGYEERDNLEKFIICVIYHQDIITYAKRIFNTFSGVVAAYVTITSFATAVIGYQIMEADKLQDRLRYAMLFFAWGLLFFLVCLQAQKVQDESVEMVNFVYNCSWTNESANQVNLRKNIVIVIARCQHPLYFRIPCLGIISLSRFVGVMKTAYSFFTILITVTEK